jgi:hypothetical protein
MGGYLHLSVNARSTQPFERTAPTHTYALKSLELVGLAQLKWCIVVKKMQFFLLVLLFLILKLIHQSPVLKPTNNIATSPFLRLKRHKVS